MDLNDRALSDMVLRAGRMVREDNLRIGARLAGSADPKIGEHAQVNTEKTLRELLVQYEANQKEQARETKKAFYVSLVALALNALAIIVTIAIAVLN